MKELSLNILDIVQNSISANATLISVIISENTKEDVMEISIIDNGKGMSEDFLKKVLDPFTTTRKTRKVGMGISLLKLVTEQTEGNFDIKSKLNEGTTVTASFKLSHIDRPPLGDVAQTISMLASCNEEIDFIYTHILDDKDFTFNTKEIKQVLNGVSLKEPDVVIWMQEYINEQENNLLEV